MVAASETGVGLQVVGAVGAVSEALGVVAELEAEVEHTVVEVEVELTVLTLKTSLEFQIRVNFVLVVCNCAQILIWKKRRQKDSPRICST